MFDVNDSYDPVTLFPAFYGNQKIQELAQHARWSVSDKNKRPMDLRAMFDEGKIFGAREISTKCLVPLAEITKNLARAATVALHLDSQMMQVMVLDIESKCPPEIRDELLRLPDIYSEVSMSGKGYHLVLPIPVNQAEYPLAATKVKLQEEHGWYEVLMYHWVTFTRKPIPAEQLEGLQPAEPGAWERVYASLAALAKPNHSIDFDVEEEEPEIPQKEKILRLMMSKPYGKTGKDFHGDDSRWEYGMLGHLYNVMRGVMVNMGKTRGLTWSDSDKVWLLYRAAEQVIPSRKKHLEFRDGYPFLFAAALKLVSSREGDAAAEKAMKTA